jgi:hypothetical protein
MRDSLVEADGGENALIFLGRLWNSIMVEDEIFEDDIYLGVYD